MTGGSFPGRLVVTFDRVRPLSMRFKLPGKELAESQSLSGYIHPNFERLKPCPFLPQTLKTSGSFLRGGGTEVLSQYKDGDIVDQ